MITISFLGLDQFVVGHYSSEHTANLASLFEASPEMINFAAPNTMVFHEGVEQTSWHTIVVVRAPKKYQALEKQVAEYLLKTLIDFSVNVELEFEYFEEASHYEHFNPDYPRFIAKAPAGDDEYDGSMYQVGEDPAHDEEDECDCHHDHDHEDEEDMSLRPDLDPNNPDDIYLGNAFEDFEKKMEERSKAMEGASEEDKHHH